MMVLGDPTDDQPLDPMQLQQSNTVGTGKAAAGYCRRREKKLKLFLERSRMLIFFRHSRRSPLDDDQLLFYCKSLTVFCLI
jgi:hypothetical protein